MHVKDLDQRLSGTDVPAWFRSHITKIFEDAVLVQHYPDDVVEILGAIADVIASMQPRVNASTLRNYLYGLKKLVGRHPEMIDGLDDAMRDKVLADIEAALLQARKSSAAPARQVGAADRVAERETRDQVEPGTEDVKEANAADSEKDLLVGVLRNLYSVIGSVLELYDVKA